MRFRKWDGTPHWEMDGVYLGADEHGQWVGARPPTQMSRPGRSVTFHRHFVGVFPYDAWWAATFYEWEDHVDSHDVYVDVTTVPVWQGATVTLVDLDLDVVREWSGTVFVDDEEEFAEHQVRLDYPAEVIAAARRSATAVADAVTHGCEPFGTVGQAWLARLMAHG